jgi:hypothetical protein
VRRSALLVVLRLVNCIDVAVAIGLPGQVTDATIFAGFTPSGSTGIMQQQIKTLYLTRMGLAQHKQPPTWPLCWEIRQSSCIH